MGETLTQWMTVEVAYALPQEQVIFPITVSTGTTALQAIQQSGLLQAFPGLSVEHSHIGVFGKAVSPDTVLKPWDRVEIYRPLLADPKQARRLRAALKKTATAQNPGSASQAKTAKTGQQKTKKG